MGDPAENVYEDVLETARNYTAADNLDETTNKGENPGDKTMKGMVMRGRTTANRYNFNN